MNAQLPEIKTFSKAANEVYIHLKAKNVELLIPELSALRNTIQSSKYHSEGDAYIHTMLCIESLDLKRIDERVFWAVLLHDIGKPQTTRIEEKKITSYKHAHVGAEISRSILKRFSLSNLSDDVSWLIKNHDFLLSWGQSFKDGFTKKQRKIIDNRLFPLLLEVVQADIDGSIGCSSKSSMLHNIITHYKLHNNN